MTAHNPKRLWFLRRRNYIIAPKLQFKIVGWLAAVSILSALIICYVAYERILLFDQLFTGQYVPAPLGKPALTVIANTLMTRLLIIVTFMVLVFVILGLYLTHKVAGPLWKLESEIQKFLDGQQIRPISFRKGDDFQNLPKLVNKLIEGYKK